MSNLLHLTLSGTRPRLGGFDHFWKTIMDVTSSDRPDFTYRQIDGACSPGFERLLRRFLELLCANGYIAILADRGPFVARTYRVVRRQRETPSFTHSGQESRHGQGQRNMWNVMRREHQGFTVQHLHIAASTDDVIVSYQSAKQYCRHLVNAGVLSILKPGERGVGRNAFILKGSANTGPRPPQRYRADFIFDPNTGSILGDASAIEVQS